MSYTFGDRTQERCLRGSDSDSADMGKRKVISRVTCLRNHDLLFSQRWTVIRRKVSNMTNHLIRNWFNCTSNLFFFIRYEILRWFKIPVNGRILKEYRPFCWNLCPFSSLRIWMIAVNRKAYSMSLYWS